MKIFIPLSIFFIFLNLNAQKVFENTSISAIVIDENGNVTFHKILNNGKYKEISFDISFAKEDKEFYYEFYSTNDDDAETYKEIVLENDFFLDVKDIIPISFENLTTQLQSKSFTTIHDEDRYSYFLFHPSFFLEARYDLESEELKKYKKKPLGDFNKIYPQENPYYFIHLGNNRYITLLDRSDLLIYNTKKGLKMVGKKEYNFQTINKNPINQKDLNDVANPQKFRVYAAANYGLIKSENGKHIVKDIFGEKILPLEYDSMTLGNEFFIGKIGNDYKIYNSYLKELPIKNVRSLHVYQNQLQVIQNNELKIYNINGDIFDKRKNNYKGYVDGRCGLRSYDEIIKLQQSDSLYDSAHYLHVEREEQHFKPIQQDFVMNKISNTATLQFLSNSMEQYKSDGNLEIEDKILVKYDGHYGLYSILDSYSLKPINELKDFNYFLDKPDSLPAMNIELKEILPIEYDSIYKLWDRIYFSKNNLHGIYGITKDVEFSELKKETSNYYRVADRVGKKGWLSYSEKKVFWDN